MRGRGLGVGQASVGGLDGDAEEPGHVAELVRLEVRIGLASDRQRVEVAAGGELAGLAQRLIEEAQIEADVVADDRSAADEREQLLGRLLGRRGRRRRRRR